MRHRPPIPPETPESRGGEACAAAKIRPILPPLSPILHRSSTNPRRRRPGSASRAHAASPPLQEATLPGSSCLINVPPTYNIPQWPSSDCDPVLRPSNPILPNTTRLGFLPLPSPVTVPPDLLSNRLPLTLTRRPATPPFPPEKHCNRRGGPDLPVRNTPIYHEPAPPRLSPAAVQPVCHCAIGRHPPPLVQRRFVEQYSPIA